MLRLTCLLFLLCSTAAHATCSGTDLRHALSAEQTAEIARLTATRAYPEHLLWRAIRGSDTAYVMGTMHVHDPAITAIFERIEPLMLRADLILTETTLDQEAELQRLMATTPALFFITTGPTLPDLMPEDDWNALTRVLSERGIPAFMAAKMQPWFLSISLSLPPCLAQDAKAGMRGLDHMIMRSAVAHDIPGRALEPIDTIFTLFGKEPVEEQLKGLKLSILPAQAATDILATMTASYIEGKHAETWVLGDILSRSLIDLPEQEITAAYAQLEEVVLNTRNRNWIPVIEAAQPEGTLFIAAGAAHLSGDAGLLRLLENAGYTLTREPF